MQNKLSGAGDKDVKRASTHVKTTVEIIKNTSLIKMLVFALLFIVSTGYFDYNVMCYLLTIEKCLF